MLYLLEASLSRSLPWNMQGSCMLVSRLVLHCLLDSLGAEHVGTAERVEIAKVVQRNYGSGW